jgi:hypothetical protein
VEESEMRDLVVKKKELVKRKKAVQKLFLPQIYRQFFSSKKTFMGVSVSRLSHTLFLID